MLVWVSGHDPGYSRPAENRQHNIDGKFALGPFVPRCPYKRQNAQGCTHGESDCNITWLRSQPRLQFHSVIYLNYISQPAAPPAKTFTAVSMATCQRFGKGSLPPATPLRLQRDGSQAAGMNW